MTLRYGGEWFEAAELMLDIEGRVRGTDASRFERAALEAVDRCAASFGTPASPKVTLTARLL